MNVIKTRVGNAEVLIEAVSVQRDSFGGMQDTSTHGNSIPAEIAENAFRDAQDVIRNIAEEFSQAWQDKSFMPDETKIGFSMSVTTTGDLWIVKAGNSMTLDVEMTWKKE